MHTHTHTHTHSHFHTHTHTQTHKHTVGGVEREKREGEREGERERERERTHIHTHTGGAVDVTVSFDFSATLANIALSKFGIALRAPAAHDAAADSKAGGDVKITDVVTAAAQNVWFEVSAADPTSGVRQVLVNQICSTWVG